MNGLWVAAFALVATIGAGGTAGAAGELKHETAQVNGIKLHYVTCGSGQTILFLHGFPEFWYAWKNQLVEFGKHYQAVAVDMRGYNLSDKPEKLDEYAMPHLVADVKALFDKLSPGKKAILVGHDWGGVVAWAFAMMHPDYLDKLVIIDAPHPGIFMRELAHNPAQQKASAYMNMFKSPGAEGFMKANDFAGLKGALFHGSAAGAFSDEDQKAYIQAWSQPGALTGGLNYYRASNIGPPPPGDSRPVDTSAVKALSSLTVTVPTLVIWGEKDTALLMGNLDGLDQYVKHLVIVRIPDGTHWLVHEQPERINRTIADFLDGKTPVP